MKHYPPTSLLIATIIISYINYQCTFCQSDIFDEIEFEFRQIFSEIVICGTNETAFPFCSDPFQSPINVISNQSMPGRDIDCNSRALDVQFNQPPHFEYNVEKKDNTIQIAAPLVTLFDNPVIPVTSTTNRVKKFCLEQFHFHWSNDPEIGGEHGIDGVRPPLEVHFVHYNW